MALNNFPYTNLHSLNLDWILDLLKEEEARILSLETWKTGTDSQIADLTSRLEQVESFISDIESGIVPQDFLNSLMAYVQDNFDTLAEPLQQAVDSLRTDLTTAQNTINRMKHLKNAKYIIIGDSYGVGWSPETPSGGNGWCTQLVNILGLNSNQYIIQAEGGAGFSSERPYTFNALLDRCSADSTVDYIIVAGGNNDTQSTDNLIYTGITSFMNTAKTKFPNAKVYCGMIGWDGAKSYRDRFWLVYRIYNEGIIERGGYYMNNIECVLHNMDYISHTDYRHPTVDGNGWIAKYMIECLECGSCNVEYRIGFTLTSANNSTVDSGYILTYIHNHELKALNGKLTFNWSSNYPQTNGTEFNFVDMAALPVNCPIWCNDSGYMVTAIARIRRRATAGGNWLFEVRPCTLNFTENTKTLSVNITIISADGQSYIPSEFSTIEIYPNTFTQDIMTGM